MIPGYQGRILRVNLSSRAITTEEYDDKWYRKYVGGYGMTAYFLLKELKPGVDPLGPDNKLIIMTGPFTGAAFSGSARVGFGAKSPMTGGIGKSEVGGYFGTELKFAGYDGLIIEGRADRPVYLWIRDGQVEIRDASHLWGMMTLETQTAIRSETQEKLARVASIGPAGENLVRFACIVNDLKDIVGRTGLGAVMGSKNLKAIAAKGKSRVEFADAAAIHRLAQSMAANVDSRARRYHEFGTGAVMDGYNLAGNLPTRNFQDAFFPATDKITAQAVKKAIGIGMDGCWACAIRCKKVVRSEDPYSLDPRYGGPEYETLAAFGSNCCVDDVKVLARAHQICGMYGMDTISAGNTIAFAMECFERGLLTRTDTGGIDLTFGNSLAMLQVLEMMGKKQGIGSLLSEGSKRAAQQIGQGAEEFAIQVKGIELGLHEPRLKQGLAVGFAVANHGADHEIGFQDTYFEKEGPLLEAAHSLGFHDPLPAAELSDRKVYLFSLRHDWMMALDSLLECCFVPWTYTETAELLRACTGWQATVHEIVMLGKRAITMGRAFNVREGFTVTDDQLPKRFFSPPDKGPLRERSQAIDHQAMEHGVRAYYYFQGWDPATGLPMKETLAGLGLEWVATDLERYGLVRSAIDGC